MIKVLIADDHAIIRDGLKSMLGTVPELDIVATMENGRQVIDYLEHGEVDVVLMDISMPVLNGIDATVEITARFPSVKVIALTNYQQHDYIRYMLNAGAKGYVLKDADRTELFEALLDVSKGKKYYSEKVMDKMTAFSVAGAPALLTEREKEILKMIAGELTNQEIADQLFLSVRTVDTHRRNLLQKLGVKNTAGLVKCAISMDLI